MQRDTGGRREMQGVANSQVEPLPPGRQQLFTEDKLCNVHRSLTTHQHVSVHPPTPPCKSYAKVPNQ